MSLEAFVLFQLYALLVLSEVGQRPVGYLSISTPPGAPFIFFFSEMCSHIGFRYSMTLGCVRGKKKEVFVNSIFRV